MEKDELLKIAKPLISYPGEVQILLKENKVQKRDYVRYKNANIIDVPKYSLELGEPYDFQIVQKTDEGKIMKCVRIEPKYKTGEIFYVKEAFFDIKHRCEYKFYYRADATPEIEKIRLDNNKIWRPSMQMPIMGARLFVRVSECHAVRKTPPTGAWMWLYELERIIPENI